MNLSEDEVVVLYSGGSDSTLAAALMCKRFRKVHLLTCRTSPMYSLEKSKANARLLRRKFGNNKVIHKFLDTDEIFKTIYRGNYLGDIQKYGTYVSACVCAACSLSWHVRAIIYDIENDIHFTCDGERYEKTPIWAEQMEPVLEMVRGFYKEYGIIYENPVYRIVRTDWKLFELGITEEKDVKLEGYAYDERGFSEDPRGHWKRTQPNCHGGVIGAMYLSCYFLPLYGQEANEKIAIEYYTEKINLCREYLQRRLGMPRG